MNLVLIHGRDQQGKDKDVLKQLWIDTLNKGLAKKKLSLPADVNVIFPFYGDLLDELTRGLDKPKDGITAKGPENGELIVFEAEMYTELAVNAAITDEQILQLSPEAKEKGVLNWEWIQAILKALDENTGMGDWSLRRFTKDVFAYLYFDGVRSQINKLILDEMKEGPTVVVGHSLGSIVGYNILQECPLKVHEYITIGSPLGLRAVTKKLTKPLKRPSCIKKDWYNAFDTGDYVALNPLDNRYFNITPSIINSGHISNHTKNQHGIEGYLNDADVAERIYKALTSK